jgi:hypothetical protein
MLWLHQGGKETPKSPAGFLDESRVCRIAPPPYGPGSSLARLKTAIPAWNGGPPGVVFETIQYFTCDLRVDEYDHPSLSEFQSSCPDLSGMVLVCCKTPKNSVPPPTEMNVHS